MSQGKRRNSSDNHVKLTYTGRLLILLTILCVIGQWMNHEGLTTPGSLFGLAILAGWFVKSGYTRA